MVFVVGSLLDMYSGGYSGNLLDSTAGIVVLGAMVFGAIVSYMKKMRLWALVAILLATGAVLFPFLSTILDDGPSAGIGLILLAAGGAAASWGAISAEMKK